MTCSYICHFLLQLLILLLKSTDFGVNANCIGAPRRLEKTMEELEQDPPLHNITSSPNDAQSTQEQ